MCSKAGRVSSPLDTPNGDTMFSLWSNELGGSPFGKVFDLGATRDQLDPCALGDTTASRRPLMPVPILATMMAAVNPPSACLLENAALSWFGLVTWHSQ